MGSTASLEKDNPSPILKQPITVDKQETLRKELKQKEFIQGQTVFLSQGFTSISGSYSKNSLLQYIDNIFKPFAFGDYSLVSEIIADQIIELWQLTKATGFPTNEYRAFPLLTQQGLAMVYFHLYMDKLPLKKGSTVPDIVQMNAFKIVVPPQPKSNYQLGGYIAASSIKKDEERLAIQNVYWSVLQKTRPPAEIAKELERQAALDQVRKIEQKVYK